jgi:ligand-binding sensor domain-containing protein
MRYEAKIFFFFFFKCFTTSCIAQQQIFTRFTANDGLVANDIRRIFQDSKGFLWIATWEGLSKFDGYKFTNYSTTNGLSHNVVNDLYETTDGKLYIACNDGSTDIISENKVIQKSVFSNVIINRFYKTAAGKVLALTDTSGLYEIKNEKLIKPKQQYPAASYSDIAEGGDWLYVAKDYKLIQVLNKKYEVFAEIRNTTNSFDGYRVFADSKKRVWAGGVTGLQLISAIEKKNKLINFDSLPAAFNIPILRQSTIREIFEDDTRNIWMGTTHGLIKISPEGLQQIFNEKNGLPGDEITCIYQDREKNIWIGTSLGIAKLVTKSNIQIYTVENNLLSNKTNFLIPFKNGKILVGTEKGMQLYDGLHDRFLPVSKKDAYYDDVPENSAISLLTTAGTDDKYFVVSDYNPAPVFFSLPHEGIKCAVKDKYGNFFTNNDAGLQFSSTISGERTNIFTGTIKTMLIDKKGYLWTGEWGKGLYRIQYVFTNKKIRIIKTDHYLPGIGIRSLYQDSKGNIWAGSRYNGVFVFSDTTGKYSMLHIDQSNGLTSNRVTNIAEDAEGCIWLSFYQGLDKLIPHKKNYRVFNFSRANNFYTNIKAMIMDKDHYLWLATLNGMVKITDGKMETIKPPAVYIVSVLAGDSTYTSGLENPAQKITLQHRQNKLEFIFAAPVFINEKQVQFSYRLLGSNNNNWSSPVNEHSVLYASLQPGNYTFEVRALGWDGNWGNAANFNFNIQPPYWQTWWFVGGCLIFAAGIIFRLVRRRINVKSKEANMKKKIAETEMMALRAQMNPHFIFNSLSSIENFIMKNEKRLASDYLNKFSRLIRSILDSSRDELVPLRKDMEALKLYIELEQLRFNHKFSFNAHIDDALLNRDKMIPSLLIQPYIENAIVHGIAHSQKDNLQLLLKVSLHDNMIQYVIEDNGVGRVQSGLYNFKNKPKHISVGMKITEDRINNFNKNCIKNPVQVTDLYDANGEASGTRIMITIKR